MPLIFFESFQFCENLKFLKFCLEIEFYVRFYLLSGLIQIILKLFDKFKRILMRN